MAAAVARMKSDGKSSLDVSDFELPGSIITIIDGLKEEECRRELWTLADEVARSEGFEYGAGLQRRAGEIMGVGEAQASKMYQKFGLAPAASA